VKNTQGTIGGKRLGKEFRIEKGVGRVPCTKVCIILGAKLRSKLYGAELDFI